MKGAAGLYITAAELDKLHVCGPLAIASYLWLRSWMDIRTGVVGVSSSVSYRGLIHHLETEIPRGAGKQSVLPTLKALRCALDRLVRAGLLVRLDNKDLLVFKLPIAQTLSLDQIEQGRVRAGGKGENANPETRANAGITAFIHSAPGRAKVVKQGNIQSTELTTSTSQAAYTTQPKVAPLVPAAAFGLAAKDQNPPAAVPVSAEVRALGTVLQQAGVRHSPADPRVVGWAEQGVTVAELDRALEAARAGRLMEASDQPINVGYINAKLKDVLQGAKRPAVPWWSNQAAMSSRARELGISDARPGESAVEFRQRIHAAEVAVAVREAG